MFSDYIVRSELLDQLNDYLVNQYPQDEKLANFVRDIQEIEE